MAGHVKRKSLINIHSQILLIAIALKPESFTLRCYNGVATISQMAPHLLARKKTSLPHQTNHVYHYEDKEKS